jgi:hypothetical protein
MMSGIVPGSRQGPSVVALSPWVEASSGPVAVPPGATHVRWTQAPLLLPAPGLPVIGSGSRAFEFRGSYAADAVYSVGFGGDAPVVADVVADSLADLGAVLDDLDTKIQGAYSVDTTVRYTASGVGGGPRLLVVFEGLTSVQIGYTGTGGGFFVEASAASLSRVELLTLDPALLAVVALGRPLGAGTPNIAGGEEILPPGVSLVGADVQGAADSADAASGAAGLLPVVARVYFQFLRRS